MKKTTKKTKPEIIAETTDETIAEAINPIPIPIPVPVSVSGLYKWSILSPPVPLPSPIPVPALPGAEGFEAEVEEGAAVQPILLKYEDLRVDVDGRYPQRQVSGTLYVGLTQRVHWIANVARTGVNRWAGSIWYKDGNVGLMPYTKISVVITPSFFPALRTARVTYSGGVASSFTRVYSFNSPYFHSVEFEYDCATGVTPITQINTCDHPNRPASMPCETLSITKVFQRAGFNVKISPGANVIPLAGAIGGATPDWSDSEMHDAMQTYWSRFANKAQWSMWVFFAAMHEMGPNLGGIMFDDIGPNERQGTALFNNSFISQAPAGDPNPAAFIRRTKFWTACHEMGHAFNLAHSWQKSLGAPWLPLADEPEARSFMNYPGRVAAGETGFYADFAYRFSDNELKFMRHAPSRFVQMGNAAWFDNHGFEQADVLPEPTFILEVRANRDKPIFEFLEPVVLELKLTNSSNEPQVIDEKLLVASDALTVIIKKQGGEARLWSPFAQYCFKSNKTVLDIDKSIYESLFIAVGKNGWDVAEPGNYMIQVSLHFESEDIVSLPFHLRITPPRGYDEEHLAQDFFSEDVGRILAFDGSQFLTSGNDTLREATERLADRKVAIHAKIALGIPLTRDYKLLALPDGVREMTSASEDNGEIVIVKAKAVEADKGLSDALFVNSDKSAETLGNIDYKHYVDQVSAIESAQGDNEAAEKHQGELKDTLSKRGVLKSVLDKIDDSKNSYAAGKTKK